MNEGLIQQERNRLFGPASFYKSALAIGLPIMAQSLIQTMVSLIDNFMVSGLGDVKMSGVNIAGQILFVFMVLTNAICASGGIFLTQYYGAQEKHGMQQALCFKIIVTGAAFFVYILVSMVIPRAVLSLMVIGNSQADLILDQGVQYMFLMGFVGLPMVISSILASSLREIGQVKAPLVISVAATIVNTFFNWVFIYGNLGAPRLEVRGAAVATIIARVVEMLIYVIYVIKIKPPFLITMKSLVNIDWKLFCDILKKGGMIIFSEMVWVVSETVTTALYNGRGGADVVSGMSSSFAIANLYFVAFGGVYTATGVIIGKLLGEGRLDEARKQKTWLFSGSVVFGIFMCFFGLATTLLIPIVFCNLSAASRTICREMVTFMALFMPLWVFNNTEFAVSRAGGDTAMGMWIDGTGTLITIPMTFLVAIFTSWGPVLMYILVKMVDVLKVIAAYIWLKRERWVKNLTIVE